MRPLVIVGWGGFGREVQSLVVALHRVQATSCDVVGFVDDAPSVADVDRVQSLGGRILGPVEWLLAQEAPTHVVIAIGSAEVCRDLAQKLARPHISFPVLVHPHATIADRVTVSDEGSIVAAGMRVNTNTAIGRHTNLDQNATVSHDSFIGEFSRLKPQACVSGDVEIECGCLVGANASILQAFRISRSSTVGAGGCVTRDVAPYSIVKGIPAR